jgi:hypothetical protein
MPDLLKGAEPVGAGEWVRMGLYAFPGWGKTSLIGTSAKVGRTLIIKSSMDLMPSRVLKTPGLEQFTADNWEKMLEVQQYFQMANHPYTWVWWDCASVHQDVLLDDVWSSTVAEKPSRAYLIDDRGRAGKPNLSPSSGLDKGEYGRNMERIQQWVRHMVGCNSFHFGISFHPMIMPHPTNDEGGDLLAPYLQGKQMTEKICGYLNLIGFLEVVEEDSKLRRLHVAENSRFYAKDLYDAFLPDGYTDNPTIPSIMTAVEKARGKPLGANKSQGQPVGRRGRSAPVTPIRRGRRAAAQ